MAETNTCPKCGAELPADAPAGLCPKCLLSAGMDEIEGQDPALAPTITPSEASDAESRLPIGTKVRYFGDYELLEEIARGGMGIVYKARQISLNRVVALKMILGGRLASDEDVKRFQTEAEAAAQLDHPGIVPIFEVGEHEGQHFFSMAFVDGESLADKIKDGPLHSKSSARYVKAIAEAVHFAHKQGIIHRDLKPANVLIDADGQPRVTDFGLAKKVEGDSDMTATGQILGTPAYMSPEQASGNSQAIGRQSDVYSLGAILYCLVTARPPFQSANPVETLIQVLEQDPVPPRKLAMGVHPELQTICLKCLEKRPRKRYATAKQLADDLDRFLQKKPIFARPVGYFSRFWKLCQRNPAVTCLIAVVGLILTASTLSMTALWLRAEGNAEKLRKHLRSTIEAGNSSQVQRVNAAKSLWELDRNPEPVLPVFIDGLKDESSHFIAAEYLGAMGSEAATSIRPLIDTAGESFYAVQAIVKIGLRPEHRDPIVKAMNGAKHQDHFFPLLAWIDRDPVKAIPKHYEALRSNDPGGSAWASEYVLRLTPHIRASSAQLIEALDDENVSVRRWAASAFISIGAVDEPAVAALREAREDTDAGVRWRADIALQTRETTMLVTRVLKQIRESSDLPDFTLRESAFMRNHSYRIAQFADSPVFDEDTVYDQWKVNGFHKFRMRPDRIKGGWDISKAYTDEIAAYSAGVRENARRLWQTLLDPRIPISDRNMLLQNVMGGFSSVNMPGPIIDRIVAHDEPSLLGAVISELIHNYDTRGYALMLTPRLGTHAMHALPALIVALQNPVTRTASNAALSLSTMGADASLAIPALREASSREDIRAVAEYAILELRPQTGNTHDVMQTLAKHDAVQALAFALCSTNELISKQAVSVVKENDKLLQRVFDELRDFRKAPLDLRIRAFTILESLKPKMSK